MSLGSKVRSLRRREGLTQVRMAEQLEISPSYLNLIEHGKRPLTAALLIRLAQVFSVDLTAFATEEDTRSERELMEVFADPLFEKHGLTNKDVQTLVRESPAMARAITTLYRTQQGLRETMESLSAQVLTTGASSRLPAEEVNDLIQRHSNYFPDLEEAAERLWRDYGLDRQNLFEGLVRYLDTALGVRVRVCAVSVDMAVRRYDPAVRELRISEVLPPRSRHFQVSNQIALLAHGETIDRLVNQSDRLTTEASRRLARMVLANYFAGAVLMPYDELYAAARSLRYDIELLGHRFRTSYEQVCHRLTCLRRPGREGIPFHLVKTDIAGNISKRFSASGIQFAPFTGGCPLWNVASAFLTPGRIKIQVSRMPDGGTYFCVARTVHKRHGGYRSPESVYGVGLGCKLEDAGNWVYSDGVDLVNLGENVVPIGTTCRLCERADCKQRAFPSIQQPLRLDENIRGPSFYTQVLSGSEP